VPEVEEVVGQKVVAGGEVEEVEEVEEVDLLVGVLGAIRVVRTEGEGLEGAEELVDYLVADGPWEGQDYGVGNEVDSEADGG